MSRRTCFWLVVAAMAFILPSCGSEGDTTPSIDTVPPNPPVGLQALSDGGDALITWAENAEPDLDGYRLYKSSYLEGPFGLVTAGLIYCPYYREEATPMAMTYFKVTAVDGNGNESAYSQVVGIYMTTGKRGDVDSRIDQ